jgi:uncharacterized protein (TIGR03437 family)
VPQPGFDQEHIRMSRMVTFLPWIRRAGTVAALLSVLVPPFAPRLGGQTGTVVRILATPNPVVLGQRLAVAVSVIWTAKPSPTGSITLTDSVVCPGSSGPASVNLGTLALGSVTSPTPGAGQFSITALTCAGRHSLVASYSGDTTYTAGSSQPLLVTVLDTFTATTTHLTSSNNPAAVGQNVTLTAQLKYTLANTTSPTGTVTFTDRSTGNVLGTAAVQTSGGGTGAAAQTSASVTTSSLASGSYEVQATYSGDNIYSASASDSMTQVLTGVSAPALPAIGNGGVVTATEFGRSPAVAPGTWIEISGSNLAARTRSWALGDFDGSKAPTMLEGTRVTIGGQPAFLSYISPGQVNAQVPSTVGTGPQSVVVSTAAGPGAPLQVTVNATQAGLLAPQAFQIGAFQFAAAVLPDGTYVLPSGAVPAVPSRPAHPGETITLYGIGFGSVVPDMPAGTIVQQNNALATPVRFTVGDAPATVAYAGLAPGSVGLYQFNIVVPQIASGDAVPLSFTLGTIDGGQSLYIAVQN